jgi:hypothetical protein
MLCLLKPINPRSTVASARRSSEQKRDEGERGRSYSPDYFAEILPRFISKPMAHKAHKRIFSDRDPLFYWLFA